MMNKIKLALSAVSMAAVLAFSAFAADTFETDANGAFDVSYSGTAGEYYAVVVLSGIADEGTAPAITEETIQYIDQKTAGADGKVSFEDILIKTAGTPSTVYLGGSDLDKAVLLGYVNKTSNYKVSGTVASDSSYEASVALTGSKDLTKTYTITTTNGEYSIDVPADTYKFVVTKKGHLSYTKNSFAVTGNTSKNITLKGGDIVADGEVNHLDLGDLLANYNNTSKEYDITGDEIINHLDLGELLKNFLEKAVVEA